MAKEKKTFEIELPDYFVHNGKPYDPGTHVLDNEEVYSDLCAAKERLILALQKEALEEENRLASLNVKNAQISVGDSEGLSMDRLQELINQAVEAKTTELTLQIEAQQTRIAELEGYVEDSDDSEDSEDPENSEESPKSDAPELSDKPEGRQGTSSKTS